MITKDIQKRIVDIAVNYIIANDDKISYEILNKVFKADPSINELETAGLLLAGSATVHNIPRKNQETQMWEPRPLIDCYGGLITFWKANVLEKFVIKFSCEQTQIDLVSQRILPSLKFLNTNNEYLTAGLGKGTPDLIDYNNEITYEVKSNYRKRKSVSGFHNANRLADCDGAHIIIYPILYDDSVDFSNKLYCFRNAIPEDVVVYSHNISQELLDLIKSGELITDVELELQKHNFEWNKTV